MALACARAALQSPFCKTAAGDCVSYKGRTGLAPPLRPPLPSPLSGTHTPALPPALPPAHTHALHLAPSTLPGSTAAGRRRPSALSGGEGGCGGREGLDHIYIYKIYIFFMPDPTRKDEKWGQSSSKPAGQCMGGGRRAQLSGSISPAPVPNPTRPHPCGTPELFQSGVPPSRPEHRNRKERKHERESEAESSQSSSEKSKEELTSN